MTSLVSSNNQQPDCISCNKYYGHEIFSNTNGKYCSQCFFRAYPEESFQDFNDGKIKKDYIEKAILTLNERERTIIKLRKLREKSITLDELGQMLKISKERVRQIETKALEKLKIIILKISQQNKEFFI